MRHLNEPDFVMKKIVSAKEPLFYVERIFSFCPFFFKDNAKNKAEKVSRQFLKMAREISFI